MSGATATFVALISISVMNTIILLVAWHEFGRPRHALTWAGGFSLVAVVWTLYLIDTQVGDGRPGTLGTMLAGLAAALNTLGFRQRSGLRPRRGLLLTAAGVQAAVSALFAAMNLPIAMRALPVDMVNAAMFWASARTLIGRRRSERIAERMAASALVALAALSGGTALCRLVASLGLVDLDIAPIMTMWIMLLPAVVAGIGLFTIFLLAADLADKARRLASIDMLTGLLNRRGFEETAAAIIGSARRNGRSLALVLIDIDRFKTINDRFGHPVGDRVLSAFASCLQAETGRRDVVARLGGEEFGLILADVDGQAAECAAEVLRKAISELRLLMPGPDGITASFGVSLLKPAEDTLDSWMARADGALYRSKEGGRNRVTCAA